jgi:hypothetical protein
VQARSVTQIEQSGSLLLGGRPEWTATLALMGERPLGFGLGVVPTPSDVLTAKAGFATVHIPTAEGYIENYLLDGRFELHSIVADLWTNLGPLGLASGLFMAFLVLRSTAELLSRRRAPALVCFLALRSLWVLAFGPLPSNVSEVAMTLGLLLLVRSPAEAPGERSAPSRTSVRPDLHGVSR